MTSSTVPTAPVLLVVGDRMPIEHVGPLTRTDFVRYAGAGGDLNPIHHDEPAARAAGMPSVFGMGMLHAGMLGTRLARWVGVGSVRSYTVRFTGQVWPGDRLAFVGRVARIDEGATHRLATLELEVLRADGTDVLTASATAVVA
jgi:acyl dehydratase